MLWISQIHLGLELLKLIKSEGQPIYWNICIKWNGWCCLFNNLIGGAESGFLIPFSERFKSIQFNRLLKVFTKYDLGYEILN